MATQHFISCEVAVEDQAPGFGNVDSTTGIPSDASLTYKSMEMPRDGLIYWGDPILNMRDNETRNQAYIPTPEPVSMRNCSTGAYYQHRTGDITLSVSMRSVGDKTEYTSAGLMPWVQLLRSGMSFEATAATLRDVVASASSANVFTPTTAASFKVGQMIAVPISGHIEVSWVTEVDTTVTCSPAFSRTLAGTDYVYFSDNLFQAPDLAVGDSVSLKMTTLEGIVEAFGCRMTSAKISVTQKQAVLEVVLKSAHIRDTHGSNTPVAPAYADGEIPHYLGSYGVYSAVVDNTAAAPAALSRTAMSVDTDTFVLTIENELAEKGYSGSLLSTSDYEVTNVNSSMEFILGTPDTALDSMLWQKEARGFFFGFGPCGAGVGMGIAMPGAVAVADVSKREFSEGTIRQKLMLNAGQFEGDVADAGAEIDNTPLRIGIVVVQDA